MCFSLGAWASRQVAIWVNLALVEALTEPSAAAPDVRVYFSDNFRLRHPSITAVAFSIRRYYRARFCKLAASLNTN
jgi:hypothetical protein